MAARKSRICPLFRTVTLMRPPSADKICTGIWSARRCHLTAAWTTLNTTGFVVRRSAHALALAATRGLLDMPSTGGRRESRVSCLHSSAAGGVSLIGCLVREVRGERGSPPAVRLLFVRVVFRRACLPREILSLGENVLAAVCVYSPGICLLVAYPKKSQRSSSCVLRYTPILINDIGPWEEACGPSSSLILVACSYINPSPTPRFLYFI